jgi:hypothetical protein
VEPWIFLSQAKGFSSQVEEHEQLADFVEKLVSEGYLTWI